MPKGRRRGGTTNCGVSVSSGSGLISALVVAAALDEDACVLFQRRCRGMTGRARMTLGPAPLAAESRALSGNLGGILSIR